MCHPLGIKRTLYVGGRSGQLRVSCPRNFSTQQFTGGFPGGTSFGSGSADRATRRFPPADTTRHFGLCRGYYSASGIRPSLAPSLGACGLAPSGPGTPPHSSLDLHRGLRVFNSSPTSIRDPAIPCCVSDPLQHARFASPRETGVFLQAITHSPAQGCSQGPERTLSTGGQIVHHLHQGFDGFWRRLGQNAVPQIENVPGTISGLMQELSCAVAQGR